MCRYTSAGSLVPSSRAAMVLKSNVSPEALDGLEEFSHVWLIFKFHKNTNTMKEARAFEDMTSDEDKSKLPLQIANRKYTFTAKITPPMLKEKKESVRHPFAASSKSYWYYFSKDRKCGQKEAQTYAFCM